MRLALLLALALMAAPTAFAGTATPDLAPHAVQSCSPITGIGPVDCALHVAVCLAAGLAGGFCTM